MFLGQRAVIVAKGVIRGTVWGLVLGGASVVSASLVAPQPAGNTPPERPLTEVPTTAEVETPSLTTPEPIVPVEETEVASAPQVAVPTQEVTAPIADTAPLELPETPDIGVTLDLPDAPDVPELALADEEPVLPNPQSLAPQVPTNEGSVVIETTPPEPTVVEPDPEDVLVVETPDAVVPDVAEEVTEVEEATPAEIIDTSSDAALETAEVTPEDVPAEVAQEAEVAEEIAMADATEVAEVPLPETAPEAPSDAPEIAEPEVVEALPDEVAEPAEPEVVEALPEEVIAPDEPAEPEVIAALPEVEEAPVSEAPEEVQAPQVVTLTDRPSNALPSGSGGVKINRVGVTQTTEEPAPEPAPEVVDPDGPALEVYAAEFENPDDKPLMAIILLDDPSFAEGPRALAEVPFAVTVLLDATSDAAAERMAAYRAAGIEVGVALSLPEGAQPADVEVALEATFASLPQTVALADLAGTNRAATGQMLAALSADGRGFISASSGLNSGLRAAQTAGVPAVEVFRDLDADGQDARVIRRFLDQAAFRARQNSGVVVVGRMRADTLSALILWGAANRAGQIAVAPVSALMTEE